MKSKLIAPRHPIIRLEKPRLELFPSYARLISEMSTAGERIWEGMIPQPNEIPEAFVARLLEQEKTPGLNSVPATVYWATMEGEVVGRIQLRHELNEALKEFGGNVGYEVRPSFRRQGVATEMLKQILATERAKEMRRLLLTCAPDNIASNKTIASNGGLLVERKYVERIERETCYYWIEIR